MTLLFTFYRLRNDLELLDGLICELDLPLTLTSITKCNSGRNCLGCKFNIPKVSDWLTYVESLLSFNILVYCHSIGAAGLVTHKKSSPVLIQPKESAAAADAGTKNSTFCYVSVFREFHPHTTRDSECSIVSLTEYRARVQNWLTNRFNTSFPKTSNLRLFLRLLYPHDRM